MNGLKISLEPIRSIAGTLLDQAIPAYLYSIIRMSVGIIYFWFGFLKFPFIPGGSPAEDLVGTWSSYIDPNLFMLLLAVFETGAGLMLLLNLQTRQVALVLAGHVCGTFITLLVGADQVFNLEYGLYSLTMRGQYIVKNLLILSSCISLCLTTPRRHKRFPLRTAGRMRLSNGEYDFTTKDISLAGVAFLVRMPDHPSLAVHDRIHVSLALPFAENALDLLARVTHITKITHEAFPIYLIGGEFLEKTKAASALEPYLSTNTDLIIREFAAPLVPLETAGSGSCSGPQTAAAGLAHSGIRGRTRQTAVVDRQ